MRVHNYYTHTRRKIKIILHNIEFHCVKNDGLIVKNPLTILFSQIICISLQRK